MDQRGDFLLFGNTLGHECAGGAPAPVVGTVGSCGTQTGDSSPDVYWRSDSPAAGQAQANSTFSAGQSRSTALLAVPAGATVTYARLYWAADRGAGADLTATLDGPGGFTQSVTADANFTNNGSYQSTADITALVQALGSGAYRVSGVDSDDLVNSNNNNLFAAWWAVVFYDRQSDPPRNLALFDGLDVVASGNNQNVTIAGFLVPNAGYTAKLGVVTYEGDNSLTGDQLFFNGGAALSNAQNPAANFFNGTRSLLGVPVSVAGDLPQLTGTAASMSGIDLDVVDVTAKLSAGQTSAPIQATSSGDVYYLGAFITSISTFKPEFTGSEKVVSDVNGGSVLPGDVLEYTINVVNSGNDTATNVTLADPLPLGVGFVPGSLEIVSGPNAGLKTNAAGDDQAEYTAGNRTVTFRLGTGANATTGGSLAVGATSVVRFRVTVNASASGTVENQAEITATGLLGAPAQNWPTDGNGSGAGSPPTPVVVHQCDSDAQCTAPTPRCDTSVTPRVCVQCLVRADCGGNTPICRQNTKTCGPCVSDNNCGGNTPACQPSGGCGECSATNTTQCTGATPVCDVSSGSCVGCVTNADCSGNTPVCNTATRVCGPCTSDANCGGNTPACQPTGACGQCSATNSSACVSPTPLCNVPTGTCTGCATDADCSGNTPACQPSGVCGQCSSSNTSQCVSPTPVCDTGPGVCVGCTANSDCSGLTPTCDPNTQTCVCVATGAEVCGNMLDEDCDGQLDNGCTDTDNDGLSDDVETQIGTDPNDADSDDDGVLDGDEPSFDQDTDGDGLINALDPDSDNDGLFDGTELGKDCSNSATNTASKACRPDGDAGATTTDPLSADSDGGGASDGSEDANLNGAVDAGEGNPTAGNGADDSSVTDTDGDGLSDALENFLGSNPNDADSDDDGLLDGVEPNPSHDTDGDGLFNVLDVDSDNDALFDGTETGKNCDDAATDKTLGHCIADGDAAATTTSALLRDSDGGGVSDGSEDANRNGVADSGETDPTQGNGADDGSVVDSDGDGLSDALENNLGSNPNDADSDDDGLPDGLEPNPSDDHDGDGKSNVLDVDSDGDGLFDGTEAGRDCNDPATDTSLGNCVADGDLGATTTGVLQADTDKGGISDGDEDANKNGVVDAGETDPNDGSDDVCTDDASCFGSNSGFVCEDNTKRCVMGCRGVGADSGCPAGQTCSSTDATIGMCSPTGSGGMAGMAGAAGSAGSSGSAGSAGAGGTDGGVGGTDAGVGGSSNIDDGSYVEGGGCGCNVPRRSAGGWLLGLALGALALVRVRRRRRGAD